MIIRPIGWSDKADIDRIYDRFYRNNEYPPFWEQSDAGKFQCSFAVTQRNGQLVVAGGVKLIPEVIFLTDKDLSPRVRLEALLQALGSSTMIAQGMKYRQLHAFVNNDEQYVKHMKKFGFKKLEADLLMLDFGEGNGQT